MTDIAVGYDSVEAVLKDLRTTRDATASSALAGRAAHAARTGSLGLQTARARLVPLDVGRYRIAYDELTAVIENDMEIAESLARRRYTAAFRGLLRHSQLTGNHALIGGAVAAGVAAGIVVPVGIALSAVLASAPGVGAVMRQYSRPLAIRACPHGNFTISGRCRRPPCSA